jgi:hypothetical protein
MDLTGYGVGVNADVVVVMTTEFRDKAQLPKQFSNCPLI